MNPKALPIVVIFTLSILAQTIPIAYVEAQAELPREQRNWEYINHDALGTNYNPQSQIHKGNVRKLELKWTYPIPSISRQGGQLLGFTSVVEGSMSPPLIVDGTVYIVLNSKTTIALDAKNGKEVWRWVDNFDTRDIERSLPLLHGYTLGHTHGINYIDGKIWLNDFGCKITVLDAKTGTLIRTYEPLCKDIPLDSQTGFGIPTNSGYYAGAGGHPPSIYRREGIIIWGVGGAAEGTWGGRAYEQGIDLNTGKVLWRFFLQPPCGDPATCKPLFTKEKEEWGKWLVDNCSKIWIQRIKACELDQDLLKNDWGRMRFNSGVSNVWGHRVVDEETGIVYFGTAQPGPNLNATHAPGFRLFGSSIIALNAKNGELMWAHQTTARNLWDYDCGWNSILTVAKVKGEMRKVIIKGCKSGIVHVFDATTGEAYYYIESPDIKRNEHGRLLNPGSKDDMAKPWANYPERGPFWLSCNVTGCLESDIAYDPSRNTVYFATYNAPGWNLVTNIEMRGNAFGGRTNLPDRPFVPRFNYTINAFDLNDGSMKWKFSADGVGFRGGVMVSGGLVWFSAPDGKQRALDADSGRPIYEKDLGSSTLIQPTIGADSDGKIKLLRIIGGHVFFQGIIGQGLGANVPGAVMAYGLPDNYQGGLTDVVSNFVDEIAFAIETNRPFSYAVLGVFAIIGVAIGSSLLKKSRRKETRKRKRR